MLTTGSAPEVVPVCNNETLNRIMIISCTIRTERTHEEDCQLLYRHGQGFTHDCDSRFTFMVRNQTAFLRLTSLTPEDSGNYTCLCSRHGGVTTDFSVNVTVQGRSIIFYLLMFQIFHLSFYNSIRATMRTKSYIYENKLKILTIYFRGRESAAP